MDRPEIDATLAEIIREVLDDPEFEIKPETSARDHRDWSSFNHINIVVAVEMRFAIKFQSAEIERIQNVGDFTSLIARKCNVA